MGLAFSFDLTSVVATVLPGILMMFGSVLVVWYSLPIQFQAAMQNFSAGLIISAVANELFPLLKNGLMGAPPTKYESVLATTCGVFIALVFMFGLERLVDEDDEEEDESKENEHDVSYRSHRNEYSPLLTGVDSMLTSASNEAMLIDKTTLLQNFKENTFELDQFIEHLVDSIRDGGRNEIDHWIHELEYRLDVAKRELTENIDMDSRNRTRLGDHVQELIGIAKQFQSCNTRREAKVCLKEFEDTLEHLHNHAHRPAGFKRWRPTPVNETHSKTEKIPYGVMIAVCADAGVDGLLVGLALSASKIAGISMSIATCIEMLFLGVSFSATIKNVTNSTVKHFLIIILPPLILIVMGLVANTFASEVLLKNQACFIGFISFSIVALLFLVTQELLIEARDLGKNSFIVNAMFFIGLLSGIVMDILLE